MRALSLLLLLTACSGGTATPPGGSEVCESRHECLNGVCECTTPGLEGASCAEATCEAECELCATT